MSPLTNRGPNWLWLFQSYKAYQILTSYILLLFKYSRSRSVMQSEWNSFCGVVVSEIKLKPVLKSPGPGLSCAHRNGIKNMMIWWETSASSSCQPLRSCQATGSSRAPVCWCHGTKNENRWNSMCDNSKEPHDSLITNLDRKWNIFKFDWMVSKKLFLKN